eukprot:4966601-Karenia_brevis.AAC.1
MRPVLRDAAKHDSKYVILWVEGDIQKARELHRKTEGVCGIVIGKTSLGLRVKADRLAEARAVLMANQAQFEASNRGIRMAQKFE